MEKTVVVCGKELKLKSSLLSIITYKSVFGTDLFADFAKLDKVDENTITDVIQTVFQVVYILNRPYSKKEFLEFIDEFDFDVLSNPDELKEVMNVIGVMLGSVKKKDSTQATTPR